MYPKVLRVETGFIKEDNLENLLDYRLYTKFPRWLRRIEEFLRTDFYLAYKAKKTVNKYDIVVAASEKVGIPLAFMRIKQPLIVITHHMCSPYKAKVLRWLGVAKKWAGVGYITSADRDFLMSYYNIPIENLKGWMPAKFIHISPAEMVKEGPIMSIGVAKRDYPTLIKALENLPGFQTEIYVSSRYGDLYKGGLKKDLPGWVHFPGRLSDQELIDCYKRARFVVIPLVETSLYGAGSTVALEAMALGKAVIATNNKGMSTFVIDGVTGLLVPPYNSRAMEEAIQKLWCQPELAYRMGQAGRKYAEENFNPTILNRQISDFIYKVYTESLP